MGRGIVMGVSWYDPDGREERVIAARDGEVHAALGRLVSSVPAEFQKRADQFLAPLLENNEPSKPGMYDGDLIVWWKRTHILEGE